tara:strand:- start:3931 stop:4425 length:495 start_codon:yes stop_codon:yes gene_type:complete
MISTLLGEQMQKKVSEWVRLKSSIFKIGQRGGNSEKRKVYAGNTSNLGKGARCALPLHPSGSGSAQASSIHYLYDPIPLSAPITLQFHSRPIPSLSHQSVSPFHHSQRRLRSPLHPIALVGVPAPKTPDHFMETKFSCLDTTKSLPLLLVFVLEENSCGMLSTQ